MWYNYPEYLESGVAGQNPTEWFGVDAVDGDAGDWIQVGAGSMYMYRDLTNDLMTAGIQRTWRRAMIAAVDPKPGDLVLDLAAGTGCSTEPFAAYGATAIACDFSVGMLAQGKKDRP